MKITLNHAGNGDCVLIESNNSSILFDGGTASSYEFWKNSILKKGKLDALVVTHIDNDHVNGVIKLLEDPKAPEIGLVLYNGAEQILGLEWSESPSQEDKHIDTLAAKFSNIDSETEIGASEGTSLSYLIKDKDIKQNSEAICIESCKHLKIGDFSISVIGPTFESLRKLKFSWLDVLDEEGIKRKILNKNHSTAFELYVSNLANDYLVNVSHDETENIEALSNYEYTRDTSLTNESSIALLIRNNNKSVLEMGDCHIETVISWLDEQNIETLELDAIKLSHHGSKNNINASFLERIKCNKFLISTNGKKFNHPDHETVSIISKFFPNSEIIINDKVEHITDTFIQSIYDYNNVKVLLGVKEIEL
ncbi:ComEC/Rec2 family competence protein [Vibrio cyclitrophicus]